jgi:hypothetical protein
MISPPDLDSFSILGRPSVLVVFYPTAPSDHQEQAREQETCRIPTLFFAAAKKPRGFSAKGRAPTPVVRDRSRGRKPGPPVPTQPLKGKGGAVGHAAVSSSHPVQTRVRFGCHSRKETDSLPFGAELKQPGRLEQR